jgi:DNA-binding transcriptional LysR family regulator
LVQVKFEELRAFQLVAETGSYADAARVLGRDASIISRRISSLEAALGVVLVSRSPRNISLTQAGAAYLPKVVTILDDLDRANRELTRAWSGLGLSA